MKKLVSVFLALAMLLTVCSAMAADLNSYTLDEIIEKAKEEGHVESVGMPDSWANWGDSWKGLTETYGIAHTDDDMSSAEELNMFANDSNKQEVPPPSLQLGFLGIQLVHLLRQILTIQNPKKS